jgi:hypothetical protein
MTDAVATTTGQQRVEAQLDNDTVRFLAENTDLSPSQAEELVRKHGDDRRRLLELAKSMKAEG